MPVNLNYRFLIRVAISLAMAAALAGILILEVLGHHGQSVPLWGRESMAVDLLTFSLTFGFSIGWLATKLTWQALRKKQVLPLHWHLKSQTLIDRLPANLLHRAFMLGLAGVVLAMFTLTLFHLKHTRQLPYHQYLILFILHTVSLTAVVTVMAVYRALGDRIPKHAVIKQKGTAALQ